MPKLSWLCDSISLVTIRFGRVFASDCESYQPGALHCFLGFQSGTTPCHTTFHWAGGEALSESRFQCCGVCNSYFVVNSEQDSDAAKIVDVWMRAKGSDVADPISLSRARAIVLLCCMYLNIHIIS